MIFSPTPLHGSYSIAMQPLVDNRGWFMRTYDKELFREIGHEEEWVQMNHSYTSEQGTIRGMHYQEPPYQEIKLVRCIRGVVFDVIVDLRQTSPTFLHWYGIRLSPEQMNMIYVPKGFAHGFQAISNDCELLYNHSSPYVPNVEKGVAYNDPRIRIEWPLKVSCISDRDRSHPLIADSFKGI